MDLKRIALSEAIPRRMVSTLLEPPSGSRIAEQLGMVKGITVRSRNMFAAIGGSFKSLVGGNIETFRTLCEDTRADAYNRMVDEAFALGANAVLGMRYESNSIGEGITEVLCYGTAVRVVQDGAGKA
ncbi:hypothetical protein DFJ74DRAFT_644927 [Hyaloraphidium curvatum]|nr:hypothetical protein DFJ74DRAFT_644927 [Hyaloraphidium curvatum]